MKKMLGLSALVLALAACSNTQQTNTTAQQPTFGANSNTAAVVSVKQALAANDDSYVTVEGRILNKVGDDEYMFSDGTAQIRVEIEDEVWGSQTVSSDNNRVRLYGEIDKELHKTELKAKQLTVLQP